MFNRTMDKQNLQLIISSTPIFSKTKIMKILKVRDLLKRGSILKNLNIKAKAIDRDQKDQKLSIISIRVRLFQKHKLSRRKMMEHLKWNRMLRRNQLVKFQSISLLKEDQQDNLKNLSKNQFLLSQNQKPQKKILNHNISINSNRPTHRQTKNNREINSMKANNNLLHKILNLTLSNLVPISIKHKVNFRIKLSPKRISVLSKRNSLMFYQMIISKKLINLFSGRNWVQHRNKLRKR